MGTALNRPLPQILNDLESFDPAEAREYEQAFQTGGMTALIKKANEYVDTWKNVEVNIAVTGQTGAGKSSFINSFRGLTPNSEDAASVGLGETTEEPTKYMHPKNNKIALWDLPGVNSTNFPMEKYFNNVKFNKYDFFLIITATRFTQSDVMLAKEVLRLRKKFFFIRTKLALDVQNDKYDRPDTCKEETVKRIRDLMARYVADDFPGVKVFLIDNHHPLEYEFPDLIYTMLDEAPGLIREAMLCTMTNLTEKLIIRKKAALQKRIMLIALGSAAGSAVLIVPGASLAVDSAIIMNEIAFYRQQFGLDDVSLRENARFLNTTVAKMIKGLKITGQLLEMSVWSIAVFADTLAVSEAAEAVTRIALPFFGSIIAGSISYAGTVAVLRTILNDCVSDALTINTQIVHSLSA